MKFLIAIFFLYCNLVFGDKIILEPPKPSLSKPPKIAIYLPGAFVPISFYRESSVAIQSFVQNDIQLWVCIIECLANFCLPFNKGPFSVGSLVRNAIKEVTAIVQTTNNVLLDNSDVFILGHSWGAVGAKVIVEHNPIFAGLAMFGTLSRKAGYPEHLNTFPIPLLCLTGELDSRSSFHSYPIFSQLKEQMEQYGRDAIYRTPIIVVPGMDHSDFCHGFMVEGDIPSELDRKETLNAIAEITGSWIILNSGISSSSFTSLDNLRPPLEEILATWVLDITEPYMTMFEEFLRMEHQVCARYQEHVVAKNVSDGLFIAVHEQSSPNNFLRERASHKLDSSIGNVKITVVSRIHRETSKFGFEKFISANEIFCKIIPAETINTTFNGSYYKELEHTSCSNYNRELIKQVQNGIPADKLDRYKRKGRQLMVVANDMEPSERNSFFKGITYTKSGDVFNVTVASFRTEEEEEGNLYCQLLSPARIAEWILSGSLIRNECDVQCRMGRALYKYWHTIWIQLKSTIYLGSKNDDQEF